MNKRNLSSLTCMCFCVCFCVCMWLCVCVCALDNAIPYHQGECVRIVCGLLSSGCVRVPNACNSLSSECMCVRTSHSSSSRYL